MIEATLNMNKMVRKNDMKEVYNHNLEGPGSLFDPNIFGRNEETKVKSGYINLQGHFIDPSTYIYVSRRLFRDLPYLVNGDKKVIINDKGILEFSPDGSTGLTWLYENYGKFKFKDKKSDLDKFAKEDFFIDKLYVLPLHYRDINTTEGTIKIDELNDLYIQLIRNTNFKKRLANKSNMDTFFIDMKIQGTLVAICEYIANMLNFKTGAMRQMAMGRNVDNSSRIVISAPDIRMKDVIGKNRVRLGYSAIPLHHIINMYPVHVISATHRILNYFYDLGLMKNISHEEFEIYFNDDFIKSKMEAYYYSYKDRSSYVEGPNGERFIFDFKFIDEDGKESKFTRGITYLELFFLAVLEFKDKVRVQQTRYPVTDKGSSIVGKFNILTTNINEGNLEIYHNNTKLYDIEDICNITPFIDNPKSFIYEETQKMSNLNLSSSGADYDKYLYSVDILLV